MSESIDTRISCGTPITYKGGGGSYLNDSMESDWYLYEAAQRPVTYCRSDILSQCCAVPDRAAVRHIVAPCDMY
jgi:hypothetical protein